MSKILLTLGWSETGDSLNYLPTFELAHSMYRLGQDVNLLVTDQTELPEPARRGDARDWVRTVRHDYRTSFCFSRNMCAYLNEHEFDIYHTHGLGTHLNHMTCATARRLHRPYLITPYCLLRDYKPAPRSGIARRIYRGVFMRKDFEQASCLRAINQEEADGLRCMGIKAPIAVIPWPSRVPSILDQAIARGRRWTAENPSRKRIALIIVDIEGNPVRKVIDAFTAVAEDDSELLLLDFGYVRSTEFARELIRERGLRNVKVVDHTDDFDNFSLLASCCATVIPTHHLYMGTALSHTLLCETPAICIHSPEWEDVPAMDCGWWCPNDQQSMESFISAAMMMDPALIDKKGANGRRLIMREYAADVIAGRMIRLYDWLLGKADKPGYVI